ncbi:pseudaminic acid biosynthesis-associated methylase [Sulfurospirillum diekertiae]|uniref:pseudaminic acid biosynthesis-associated methylase n=1 Tax=Sulfurospirillum diekertiae TaxID=1854492 RepID=UPI001E356484|nr:pseudaminic acid biosynthesis-associated methylase [Sulfurospirillum diekertiae]
MIKKSLLQNISLFSKILKHTNNVNSIMEFGSNIGLNLLAIQQLLPDINLSSIEINSDAIEYLKKIENLNIYHTSILEFTVDRKRDFVFTKGVLIHINPEELQKTYEILYETSNRYICVCEYYNPTPVGIDYRGS